MSRLTEILGVEEDQEYEFSGTMYRIHNGRRQYFSGGWWDSNIESVLVAMINHPEKINRLRRWTEQDVEDAKSVKRLIPGNPYIVNRNCDGVIIVSASGGSWEFRLNGNSFPSLKPGEGEMLDEIIGGAE